jgi:hypothetical protein
VRQGDAWKSVRVHGTRRAARPRVRK